MRPRAPPPLCSTLKALQKGGRRTAGRIGKTKHKTHGNRGNKNARGLSLPPPAVGRSHTSLKADPQPFFCGANAGHMGVVRVLRRPRLRRLGWGVGGGKNKLATIRQSKPPLAAARANVCVYDGRERKQQCCRPPPLLKLLLARRGCMVLCGMALWLCVCVCVYVRRSSAYDLVLEKGRKKGL